MKYFVAVLSVVSLSLFSVASADDKQRKISEEDLPKEVRLEAKAAAVTPIGKYAFNREANGDMTFKVYRPSGGFVEVNDPKFELVAIVDHALKNPAHHQTTFYRVGSKVGIRVDGVVRGATAPDGKRITHYWFQRISSGQHSVWLLTEDSRIHGGWNLPWDTVLAIVRSVSAPTSSTMKVIKTPTGDAILINSRTYELEQ